MSTLYIHYPNGNGVTSVNGLTGAITLAAGNDISITPSGNTLTIASTGSPSFPLLAPNDSANAPSYSWANSTGTGIYRAGINILGFASAGVAAGQIDASQQWIIGSSSSVTNNIKGNNLSLTPTSGVETVVSAKSDNTGDLALSGSSGSSNGGVILLYGNAHLTNANKILFNTSGSLALTIDASQNALFAGTLTSTGQLIGKGTATNNSAAAGNIGEYVESVISSTTSIPGSTGQYGNLTSISLTAGDWEVNGLMSLDNANSATITTFAGAISVNSGNTTTDQIDGSNQADSATPGAAAIRSIAIPGYRLLLSTTTTVFLKMAVGFAVATPQYRCRISARRMR